MHPIRVPGKIESRWGNLVWLMLVPVLGVLWLWVLAGVMVLLWG